MNPIVNKDQPDSQEKESARSSTSFINNAQNNSARTKPNLIQIPSITLPKGGGAIKSIDEKFSVNALSGTASLNVPLPFSPGRNGNTPSLTLTYNSGNGNSVFGLGWTVEVPAIQRKTDKQLPKYKDGEESDTFIFSGAEDLIPVPDDNANDTGITRYRPRIEGSFARIEKINENGNIYWKVRSKDNIVSVFGKSDDTKLFSPVNGEENKIFRWCLEYSYDDKGNFAKYNYKKEDKDNVASALSEKNRLNGLAPFTNIYYKGIQYGNKVAYYENDSLPAEFLFELIFDYGEHDKEKPTTKSAVIDGKEKKWTLRKDPFSDYRAGFEIRTYRICERILMFHHMKPELGIDDYLVRSLELNYQENPHLTYLEKITQTGYIWNPDESLKSKKSLPPMQYTYFKPGFSNKVKEISPDDIIHDPIGIDNQLYQWTDLYNEGISGILTEQATGWFYKENYGNGKFSNAKLVSPKPSFEGLNDGTVAFQDLEANGKKFLVTTTPSIKGYFELTEEDEWISLYPFTSYPNIDLRDPNIKFLDLNGDGLADLLISHEQEFIWYASKGKAGYDDHSIANKAIDEEKGPVIVFSDADEKMMIALADMTGDGLADIVLLTNSSICYYPNLGYGRFGARVTMEMAGCFASTTTFTPQYLYLSDIDGSGTTDIIYTGNDTIQVWYNQSGNRLDQPSEFFNPFPKIDNEAKISFIDLLGNGTACLVWSSPLPEHSGAPLKYIDIMDGRHPHIMYGYKNNLGKEVTIEYKSSTHYYLEDKKKGRKWITKLPFPVQCVSKVVVTDKVAQTRFANEYTYHHGYYDAIEREFRGFAMVEQKDTEEYDHFEKETQGNAAVTVEKKLFQPAVITRSWFHTGAFLNRNKFFHLLQDEYYPGALIKEGKITDAEVIRTLDKYILPETGLQTDLSTDDLIESCRALKGLPLRKEVYSEEGNEDIRLHPYTVIQNNYDVQCLQKKGDQKHGVFLSHEKETLAFHYERNPLDPRIAHSINIEIDKYGNIKQAASVVYGRKKEDDTLPTINDRKQQTKQYITYTKNLFTEIFDKVQAYHLPVKWSSETWELNTASPEKTFFTSTEVTNRFANAGIKPYEKETLINEKRKIEDSRTLFLKNDLTGPAAPGFIDIPALPYENYLLALTPSLWNDIYNTKVDESLLRDKALYVQFENDGNYWIKSGRAYFHPDLTANPLTKKIDPPTAADVDFAKKNFYLPVAYEDNFKCLTKVFYDQHKLLLKRMIDAADNEISAVKTNYRTLTHIQLRDVNDNISGVRFDELGLLTHRFVMGKENEFRGDKMDPLTIELSPQDQPGSILEYEFRYHDSNGILPNRVKSSVREKHHYKESANPNQPEIEIDIKWQESYSYSDGSGHEVLKKVQDEPGQAPERDQQGKLVKDASGKIQLKDTGAALRWVGNGRTIFNNKGNPVKQYEPYYDCIAEYNDEPQLAELGFTSVIFYDALGRVIRTEHPNGAYSKIEFNAWMQKIFDENDTAGSDAVVDGLAVAKWYTERINAAKGEAEQQAAIKTKVHYNTPSVNYMDSLGRIFLSVTHNKTKRTNEDLIQEFYYIRTDLDIEGNARSIRDARGNEVMNWKYDMLGNICFQHTMDAGDRWMLADATGKAIRLWDNRGQQFFYYYDELHRPSKTAVKKNAGEEIFEKYEYGESIPQNKKNNLRGNLYRHSDTAGININEIFDFKGNMLRSTRQLLKDYKKLPNWDVAQDVDDEIFANEIKYDALNRALEIKSPDNSIVFPLYNESGRLGKLDVRIKGSNVVTHFITRIDHNAKGQREKIVYGNNSASDITTTFYTYEPETYRLTRLLTIKKDDSTVLQDLNYTYDPVGNITRQFDNAQKTKFYGGQKIEAQSNYVYDAIYRLIEAEGREHSGQVSIDAPDNWNDGWCKNSLQPGSDIQLRNYTQKYFYDETGNITKMRHIAGSQPASSWTRTCEYAATNNQLLRTVMGNDVPVTSNHDYTYNEHGSMKTMPHLLPGTEIDWNLREEMQHLQLGGGGEAWYVYDSAGQRIRKVVEKDQQREERIYLWGAEIFRMFDNGNPVKKLERETFHVMDDKQRIAMVETRTAGNDGSPQQLLRYQFSNHLGTACVEVDDQARIISYEEYHPYGTTAYQAVNKDINPVAKRYRYTGMERDEESGFNYHTARYYIPWLGRWLNVDPFGLIDTNNLYRFLQNNPVRLIDPNGTDPVSAPVDSKDPRNFKTFDEYKTANKDQPIDEVRHQWYKVHGKKYLILYDKGHDEFKRQAEQAAKDHSVTAQSVDPAKIGELIAKEKPDVVMTFGHGISTDMSTGDGKWIGAGTLKREFTQANPSQDVKVVIQACSSGKKDGLIDKLAEDANLKKFSFSSHTDVGHVSGNKNIRNAKGEELFAFLRGKVEGLGYSKKDASAIVGEFMRTDTVKPKGGGDPIPRFYEVGATGVIHTVVREIAVLGFDKFWELVSSDVDVMSNEDVLKLNLTPDALKRFNEGMEMLRDRYKAATAKRQLAPVERPQKKHETEIY